MHYKEQDERGPKKSSRPAAAPKNPGGGQQDKPRHRRENDLLKKLLEQKHLAIFYPIDQRFSIEWLREFTRLCGVAAEPIMKRNRGWSAWEMEEHMKIVTVLIQL